MAKKNASKAVVARGELVTLEQRLAFSRVTSETER
jgi:hypothetical protein